MNRYFFNLLPDLFDCKSSTALLHSLVPFGRFTADYDKLKGKHIGHPKIQSVLATKTTDDASITVWRRFPFLLLLLPLLLTSVRPSEEMRQTKRLLFAEKVIAGTKSADVSRN